jgi:transposase-like protein
MAPHSNRNEAIRRCLEQGQTPSQVAVELGVAASTLRGWLRLARQERELETLRQRQEQLVNELHQAAAALAELRRLMDQAAPSAHKAVG